MSGKAAARVSVVATEKSMVLLVSRLLAVKLMAKEILRLVM